MYLRGEDRHQEARSIKPPLQTIRRKKRIKRVGFEASRMLYEVHQRLEESAAAGRDAQADRAGGRQAADGQIGRRDRAHPPQRADQFARRSKRPSSPSARASRESAIAAELEYQMRRLGAEKAAFETIVAIGPRSALPHAQPTPGSSPNDELLLIDMGACQDGYMSDMTRVLFLGKPSQSRAQHVRRGVESSTGRH